MILIQKTQIDYGIIFIAAVYLIQFLQDEPSAVMVLWAWQNLYLSCRKLPFVIMYSLEICNYSEPCKNCFRECFRIQTAIAILYGKVST